MTTIVKAFPVRVFELLTADNTSLGLFKIDSEWQGMQRLVSLADETQCVIVDMGGNVLERVFGKVFAEVFGADSTPPPEFDVVKASPDLAAMLKRKQS